MAEQSTAVEKFFAGNVPADPSKFAQNLQQFADTIQTNTGRPWVIFSKQGEWTIGQDRVVIKPSERWAVNPQAFKHGFIGWNDGKKVGEVMAPHGTPIDQSTLEPIKSDKDEDGWKAQLSLDVKSLDDGTEGTYSTGTYGGLQAVKGLVEAIVAQFNTDPAHAVPIIHLKTDSYKHRRYGEVFTPVIEVIAWADMEGNVLGAAEPRRDRELM